MRAFHLADLGTSFVPPDLLIRSQPRSRMYLSWLPVYRTVRELFGAVVLSRTRTLLGANGNAGSLLPDFMRNG